MRWTSVLFLPFYRTSSSHRKLTFMDWEPLPQRMRQRRRYLASSSSSATTTNSEEPPPNTTSTPRRKNRPGFNSYLKVDLDNSTMQHLRNITLDVSSQLNATLSEQQQTTGQTTDDQEGAPAKNKRTLRIKPRSLSSLHMTLFFGGETLCEIPVEELTAWHGQVSKRLHKTFHDKLDYSFQITDLQIFPPRRNNLIVAILEPAENWQSLHNDLRAFASEHETLQTVLNYSRDKWTAHITLANLINERNKPQMKILREILANTNVTMSVQPSSISMGGPVPQQDTTLDWTFPLRRTQTTPTTTEVSSNNSTSYNSL